jgi:hypothetical protein
VYYVHVHKSGGTTLCAIAGANGLRVNLVRALWEEGSWVTGGGGGKRVAAGNGEGWSSEVAVFLWWRWW